jgi:hypothetical protein
LVWSSSRLPHITAQPARVASASGNGPLECLQLFEVSADQRSQIHVEGLLDDAFAQT